MDITPGPHTPFKSISTVDGQYTRHNRQSLMYVIHKMNLIQKKKKKRREKRGKKKKKKIFCKSLDFFRVCITQID